MHISLKHRFAAVAVAAATALAVGIAPAADAAPPTSPAAVTESDIASHLLSLDDVGLTSVLTGLIGAADDAGGLGTLGGLGGILQSDGPGLDQLGKERAAGRHRDDQEAGEARLRGG